MTPCRMVRIFRPNLANMFVRSNFGSDLTTHVPYGRARGNVGDTKIGQHSLAHRKLNSLFPERLTRRVYSLTGRREVEAVVKPRLLCFILFSQPINPDSNLMKSSF